MRYALLGLLLSVGIMGLPAAADETPDVGLLRLRLKMNPEFPAWSPEYVMERCAEHLATVPEEDRPFTRYFDLSDVPRDVLPAGISALFFACNSASSATFISTPRAVPNADNRLFWVDTRWYNWTPEVWENVANEDPFFREPLIPSGSTGLNFLREQTAANPVIRADWFVYYTFDTTQFLGRGETQADQAFYYQLTYGLSDRTVQREVATVQTVQERKIVNGYWRTQAVEKPGLKLVNEVVRAPNTPRTAAEFEQFWKVDMKMLTEWPIDQGAVVDEGRSAVAFNNRSIWRIRTSLGTYWRTFDVFRSVGDQDFVENPFPKEFDAGEHIVLDAKGAQHYFLTDGAGNRVEFGDPRAVRDHVSGARVLSTSHSCIHCHSVDSGIIPIRNELVALAEEGVQPQAATPERAGRVQQFLFGDLNRLIKQDQDDYANFVRNVNGLSPQENGTQFGRFRTWYGQPVTLAQAAREIGCDPQELADAISVSAKGRLGRMALSGTPIPRVTWERGLYQEAFLLLLEHRKAAKIVPAG